MEKVMEIYGKLSQIHAYSRTIPIPMLGCLHKHAVVIYDMVQIVWNMLKYVEIIYLKPAKTKPIPIVK